MREGERDGHAQEAEERRMETRWEREARASGGRVRERRAKREK